MWKDNPIENAEKIVNKEYIWKGTYKNCPDKTILYKIVTWSTLLGNFSDLSTYRWFCDVFESPTDYPVDWTHYIAIDDLEESLFRLKDLMR